MTVCALLMEPTPVCGKLSKAGCTFSSPAAPPIPLNAIDAEVAKAWELTVSDPAAVPFVFGVKITPVEQLAPAPRLAPHVFCVRLKGFATVSVSPVAVIVLVFVIVAICAALVWPKVATENVI